MKRIGMLSRRELIVESLFVASTAVQPMYGGTAFATVPGHNRSSPLSFDNLYDSSIRATHLQGEAADRLALRRLVDAWAHFADRRLADKQTALFIPDGRILGYSGDPATHAPDSTIVGRPAIRQALDALLKFNRTLHVNGQSDFVIEADRAIGETYCLAHQILAAPNEQRKRLQTLGIRYQDRFIRTDDRWLFTERALIVEWSDTRVLETDG